METINFHSISADKCTCVESVLSFHAELVYTEPVEVLKDHFALVKSEKNSL